MSFLFTGQFYLVKKMNCLKLFKYVYQASRNKTKIDQKKSKTYQRKRLIELKKKFKSFLFIYEKNSFNKKALLIQRNHDYFYIFISVKKTIYRF